MMRIVLEVLQRELSSKIVPWNVDAEAINCHHNYVTREEHFGEKLFVTRKGAISARAGELGIIPGSMGAKSYVVRGLGNAESLCSCSHGAGRRMSRTAARRKFSQMDLEAQTAGVECRKDGGVIDEIPGAYKDIDAVMENQRDLVEVVHTLRQVICVKG
jgi:tRNA-splicing ligase RtcB